MTSEPVVFTQPQGSSAGSPMTVQYVGITPPQPVTAPVPSPPPPSVANASPAPSRVQTTRVDTPAPAARPDPGMALEPSDLPPRPVTQTPPAPPQSVRSQAAASPPDTPKPQRVWGQPPGMLPESTAPIAAGTDRSPRIGRGRGQGSVSDQPSLEVGGYQVVYDTTSQTRLREWREQGITELFIPLPGTRDYMVCPLETALRRESSDCRMVPPDDPALANIGDAREVIGFHRVYRRGEVVWRGPGPYR